MVPVYKNIRIFIKKLTSLIASIMDRYKRGSDEHNSMVKYNEKGIRIMKKPKLQKHTDNPNCSCIFCKSACPSCGSKDIKIGFLPRFEYSYPEDDCIDITHDINTLELHCDKCNAFFLYDEEDIDANYKSIVKEVFNALDLADAYCIRKDEKGKISSEKWDIVQESDTQIKLNNRKE
jgi:hypothetical protein